MKSKSRKYLLAYTLLFTLITVAISAPLWLAGKSLVLSGDPIEQHLGALIYYGRWLRDLPGYLLREHALPTYSLSIGYGSDVIDTLHFYVIGDPLNLLSALVPSAYTAVLYTVLIVLRMYLMGLTFSGMWFYLRASRRAAVTRGEETFRSGEASGGGDIAQKTYLLPGWTSILSGAMIYVFSAYTIFGGWRHPFFLNPMIYMPLLIVGAEKIRTERKHLLFALAVALSAVSNFYFFYMIAVVTVVYVLWKCVCVYGSAIGKWLCLIAHLTGAALTGVMAAGVILLPILFAFAGNPRSGGGYLFDALYSVEYYLRFPASLVTFWSADEWGYIGISAIALISLAALVVTKTRRDLQVLFLIGVLALLLPAAGYAMNGFSYVSNRWVWAFILLCACMTVEGWEVLRRLFGRRGRVTRVAARKRILLVTGIIIVALFALSLTDACRNIRTNLWISLGLLSAGILILWFKSGMAALFSLLILGICCNGIFGIVPALGGIGNGYSSWDHVLGEDAAIFQRESAAIRAVEGADDFYRYSGKGLHANCSTLDGAPATQFYWSLASGYLSDFYGRLGLCNSYGHAYGHLDDRTILNEVAGVKDFYTEDPSHVPYGYDLLDEATNPRSEVWPIYRNRYTLPFGIAYNKVISVSAFDALDPGARGEVMLTAAVVPDKDAAALQAVNAEDASADASAALQVANAEEVTAGLTRTARAFSVKAVKGKALIEGNKITALEDGAKIRFRFEGTPEGESFLYLGGIDYRPEGGSPTDLPGRLPFTVKAYAGKEKMMTWKHEWFTPKEKWSVGRDSFMFPGGYHEEPITSFVLTLPVAGVYTFDEMGVYTQPLGEAYVESAMRLGEEAPDRVDTHTGTGTTVWATNRVDAHVSFTSPKLLCMQMTYSKGWRAYVDGEEVPVICTDLMFTGAVVEAGEHDVSFRYVTPGLVPGAILTLIGLGLMVGYAVVRPKLYMEQKGD